MNGEHMRMVIQYAGGGWFGIFAGAIGVLVVGGFAVVAFQLRGLYARLEKTRQAVWEIQIKLAKREAGHQHETRGI